MFSAIAPFFEAQNLRCVAPRAIARASRAFQITVVSICSGDGDRKITCEPLQAPAAGDQPLDDDDDKKLDLPQPLDSPPELFRDAEFN